VSTIEFLNEEMEIKLTIPQVVAVNEHVFSVNLPGKIRVKYEKLSIKQAFSFPK
jgi:hypothetical protein